MEVLYQIDHVTRHFPSPEFARKLTLGRDLSPKIAATVRPDKKG